MEVAVQDPVVVETGTATNRNGNCSVLRREQWTRRGSGGLQHTQIEATHWSAPAHKYGKVVEGVSCVGADGRSLKARRQVEVLSARGPGLLQVLTATHTTSHSHSSTTTGFHRHFDDLQLSLNPLDVSSQKERLSIGRSGMLSGRRPPTKVRSLVDGNSTVSRLCHWFDADSQPQLQSPSIVANGSHKINSLPSNNGETAQNGASDKHSTSSESTDISEIANDSKNSEENLYDSCPERESVFKDESEQLEEWRRASKVRRSLQYPGKSIRSNTSKPLLDLPDNWGSVSRIKKELENSFTRSIKSSYSLTSDESSRLFFEKPSHRPENITEEPENADDSRLSDDNFLIKPSTLKKKSFIDTNTLNELRGKLRSVGASPQKQQNDLDDGIETGENCEKTENVESKTSIPSVRSYVFGMEASLNSSSNNSKTSGYSCGTNSLESRVSKLINGAATRSEDWHARRKSYGFEKVQNNQKMNNHLLSSHDKNTMESSTDSGICRSTEVVNSSSSGTSFGRGTVITLGSADKRESFESWLHSNRKPVSISSLNRYQTKSNDQSDDSKKSPPKIETKDNTVIAQSTNQISISIPVKDDLTTKPDVFQRLYENSGSRHSKTMTSSVTLPSKSEQQALKRHTIAVDGFKNPLNEYSNDIFEKKNKKVEFCKTEVHFTADSGKVNIVETDEKPPSTNNFRRRRRNSGIAPIKENEKSSLSVTHFGDDCNEKSSSEIPSSNGHEHMKLNYAVITEIKSSAKDSEAYDPSDVPVVNGNEDLEAEQPRGILKNKPIKPKPYVLGEDKNVLLEINNTQFNQDTNVWGIKLKPVHDKTETPLWCSSVTLKNDKYNEATYSHEKDSNLKSDYGKIEKLPTDQIVNETNLNNYRNSTENKGYSTKINFGCGDPIVESSYNLNKSAKSVISNKDYHNEIQHKKESSINHSKQSTIVSKYLSNSSTKLNEKENETNDELKVVNKIKNALSLTNNSKTEVVEEKENTSTFADTISTPRSLMPTRGSARKLKEHELSYFGVKTSDKDVPQNQNSLKRQTQTQKTTQVTSTNTRDCEIKQFVNTQNSVNYINKPNVVKQAAEHDPIYENIKVKKISNEVNMKRIHSGESIIDELTKAADEILQALNDYSDDEPLKFMSEPGSQKSKNAQPLATISESVTWRDRSKTSENKAVQTIIGGTRRYSATSSTVKPTKTRTSSNSSLESIVKDTKVSTAVKKKTVVENVSIEKPERPHRKKSSSGDVVKARRLQRANSREALLHFHGSSSEDIAGHLEVSRKKTVRKSKHNGDLSKKDDVKSSTRTSEKSERKKESSRSSTKYISSMLPEIRHKTAISTIMSLTDRHSDKAEKSKSSHERSRHKERTVSSSAREKTKERSHSTDTSLERDNVYIKEKYHSYRRDKTKSLEGDRMKKLTEESDNDKRNKSSKRSTGLTTTNGSLRSMQRGSHPERSPNTGAKVTNVRTEYDKSLRLI